jgi:DNA replication protein DnaC
MERHDVLELLAELKLYGIRAAFDEIIANGVKRQHPVHQIVGDLLKAEIAEKQARSIKYQLTIAKLPLAKEIEDFTFTDTPINEQLVRELATGDFLAHRRNIVLVGGTGTGKTHLAVALARSFIRKQSRGRFYTVVDLVNRLEAETRVGKPTRELASGARKWAVLLTISHVSTSFYWMNWAICHSLNLAGSSCST